MKTYTIAEAIEELASNAGTAHGNGYSSWKCLATLGSGECKAEGSFATNDEEWSTGIFDGEEYNEQDFDEWLEDYFEPEFKKVSEDALSLINEEMKEQMFEAWCKSIWNDAANEDNYEPYAHRQRRIAESIFDSWKRGQAPDNVFICREKNVVILLTADELEFANKPGNDEIFHDICEGCVTSFVNSYEG